MLVSGTSFALGYLVVFLVSAAVDTFILGDSRSGDPQVIFMAVAAISPLPSLLHAAAYVLGALKWPPAPPARTALIAGSSVALIWWVLTALTSGADSKLPAVLAFMAAILAAFFAAAVVRRKAPQAKT